MPEGRGSSLRWVLDRGLVLSIISFLYSALRFMNPPAAPQAAVDEDRPGAWKEERAEEVWG